MTQSPSSKDLVAFHFYVEAAGLKSTPDRRIFTLLNGLRLFCRKVAWFNA
jgi:hypothetical protein